MEAGDQIQLTGAALLTSATTALYNSGSSGDALTVTRRRFGIDGETLGSEIAFPTLSSVSFPANSVSYLTFSDLNATVPENVVWTLAYTTSDRIALEFLDFDPPTIGSCVLSEASQAIAERDYHGLRCYTGAAPITRQSGKKESGLDASRVQ